MEKIFKVIDNVLSTVSLSRENHSILVGYMSKIQERVEMSYPPEKVE